jgi:hypothetical protein
MGLNDRGKNKQRRKKGFNRQLGRLNLLLFTIKKAGQQTRSEHHNQNIHRVLIIIYPQITQISTDFSFKLKNDFLSKNLICVNLRNLRIITHSMVTLSQKQETSGQQQIKRGPDPASHPPP